MKILKKMSDESGQTVILAALCMTVLIGFLGFAIDAGHLRYVKRQLQADADAVALAAAREIRVCATNGQALSTCPYMIAAAKGALAENEAGYTGTPSSACGGSLPATQNLTLEVHTPCSGSDPNFNNKTVGYIEAIVSKQEPTYFAQFIGINNVSISARAEATRNTSPPCIYALDPSGSGAINVTLNALSVVNCAIIDESSSPTAFVGLLCLITAAPRINVTGGDLALLALLCPNVHINVPPPTPADPLAYLTPPAGADADCPTNGPTYGLLSTTYTGSPSPVNISLLSGGGLLGLGVLSNVTFNPGIYCGGINIALNVLSTITFNPGVYILRPQGTSGGLSINVNAASTITTGTGDPGGVMFYNEGPAQGAIGGLNVDVPSLLGTFNLIPPTSGEYAGVLYFQRSDNSAQDTVLANLVLNGLSAGHFDGAIYAPNALLNYTVSALGINNNILVAKDINFTIGALSTFGNNLASTSIGSPLIGDDAVLVQ